MDKKVIIEGNGWFLPLLFLIFLTLKLTNYISWSWWWVAVPLWGPVVLVIVLFVLFVFFVTMVGICKGVVQFIKENKKS